VASYGKLQRIPFGALIHPQTQKPLLTRFSLSHVPSLDFSDFYDNHLALRPPDVDNLFACLIRNPIADLHYAHQESSDIASHTSKLFPAKSADNFGSPEKLRILGKPNADDHLSKSMVLKSIQECGQSGQFVHFSSHSLVHSSPEAVFAAANIGGIKDAIEAADWDTLGRRQELIQQLCEIPLGGLPENKIWPKDLQELNLAGLSLVFLNSCQSGLGYKVQLPIL